MDVLVTGAAGFLGSHLMLHHLEAGDRVLGLDNYSSSIRQSRHIDRIRQFENGLLEECDITRPEGFSVIRQAMLEAGFRFDVIYNFACPASPPVYQSIPIETMMTCVVGTRNVLELARDMRCTVVHASTSEVYGNPTSSPQTEDYWGNVNSYGPRSCYDEGKRAAEALCFDYFNKYDVDARLVRIFNTYGPHMDARDGRVVTNFIHQALKGAPLTIYGTGEQTRSFCYVDDLIRGIVALGALAENPRTPVNLGNPNEFTMKELASLVSRLTLSDPANIVMMPLPIDDPIQRRPNIELAKTLLGWQPVVQLDEGVMRTIEYLKADVG